MEEEKQPQHGEKGKKQRMPYKDRSPEEKFRFLSKMIEEISYFLELHDIKTEAGERLNYGKLLEIAMLFDDPPSTLKEEWVAFFDEKGLPLLMTLFFRFCWLASLMHRNVLASLKKDGFQKGDRVKVASFELFGPSEKVEIPAGRIGTISGIEPGEFCDIAYVVLDDFSYGGYDFHAFEAWMRLDQLERIDGADA